MKLQLETNKGWTEAIIDNYCDFSTFNKVADLLLNDFSLTFSNKFNDLDTIYWDFEYKGNNLVLHYNVYLGVSVFPLALESANQTENKAVVEISTLLIQKIIELDWTDFENAKTIGTKGSEGGTIVYDSEHSKGARITLEKECGTIPFAITVGIYGLMVHTHFENYLEKANEYVNLTKGRVNKILELYDVQEDERDDYWQNKLERKINELTESTETTKTDE